MARLHEDELEIDEDLVRRLLGTVSPAYAGLPLRALDVTGSSNRLFRLGEDLLVRLPRQPGGSETIAKEQRWLPYVAAAVPVPVPEVVAVGRPAFGYPESWALVRWTDGVAASAPSPGEAPRHPLALDLAAVANALRALPVPEEARTDPGLHWYRCRPLAELDDDLRGRLAACRRLAGLPLDVDAAERAWERVLATPEAQHEGSPRWLHGDLLGENLLVRDGRLTAVLDFGGLGVGDPAVDLAVAWDVLDADARATFRAALGVGDGDWQVGRGWALAMSVMTFPYYWETMPERCAGRLAMAEAVLAEPAPG